MKLNKIRIHNFKSIYGNQYFDFNDLEGLIKLSGPIGAGKTTLAEAILWGLYGTVKGQNNTNLVAWNTKACEVELWLTAKNKEVHITRNIIAPLIVEVEGKRINGSSKRDMQEILENEIYDTPKLAIVRMCVISFNSFNSLASMTPYETKMFLDEIFGFKLFTEYTNEINIEKKDVQNESIRLNAILDEKKHQIETFEQKKTSQQEELSNSMDIDKLNNDRANLVEKGKEVSANKSTVQSQYANEETEYSNKLNEIKSKMDEYSTLGKHARKQYDTFKSGKCPTCGNEIDENVIKEYKETLDNYINLYKEYQTNYKAEYATYTQLVNDHKVELTKFDQEIAELKNQIREIDKNITIYNNNLKIINENYDDLINSTQTQIDEIQNKIDSLDIEFGEWNDMSELFAKTLRYNLLETFIPHINNSIQQFINKMDQPYKIHYDQEFKAHIFVDGYEKEISYNNLSTGQKKSLDLAIIFGILQNIISNVDFNVLILDELFSNMDTNARNIMLELLNESLSEDKSIFVINHAEMSDDYFDHKIRVSLKQVKIKSEIKGIDTAIIKASMYEKIF